MPASDEQRASQAVEDYIKHIYKLSRQGEKATTKALAERMGLGCGTVSGMLRQLSRKNLVHHRPYYGVQLTEQGHRLAMRIIRRHRLIELFLVQTLGLGWDEVDRDAEKLEHVVSDKLIDRIDTVLGHPVIDPHGAPIPDAAGRVEPQDFQPLAECEIGTAMRVRRVSDREPEFLQYLQELGIQLDSQLEVVSVDPFGMMRVRIDHQEVHITREAARRIQVSPA